MTKSIKSLHSLSDIIESLKHLLTDVTIDLEKSNRGNKAASQRVRTGTVKLEKVAKLYRKESIKHEKSSHGRVKKAKAPAKHKAHHAKSKTAHKATAHKAGAHKTAHKAHGAKSKTAHKATAHKATAHKKTAHKSHAKAKTTKATAKPKAFSLKRPTAKLPTRHAHR